MSLRARARSGRGRSIVRRAAGAGCEILEPRFLLSTISWVNQGAGDGFDATYGTNAAVARAIVGRALADWGNIIENFNYTGGSNVFNITINATAMPSSTSRGDCSLTAINAQGKPTAATVRLDDNGAGDGWYFDPNIGTWNMPDDGEFDNLLGPFAADTTADPTSGYDFYRTVLHEVGHAMGISSGWTIGGNTIAIDSFLTDTGFDDPNTTATTNLWRFSRNGVVAGFTKHGGLHTYEGPIPSGLTNFASHPNDLMNAGRTVTDGVRRRQLISDTVASVLREAYGYTVLVPSTVNNFYVNADYAARKVTISGQVGNNNDLVIVQGTALQGQLHVTVGTVGGGATFTEIIPWPQIDDITVNSGNGNDIVRIEFNGGRRTEINLGDGDDIADFAFATRNLTNITGSTTVRGGAGNDRIYTYDNSYAGTNAYSVTSARFDRSGWGGFLYASDLELLTLTTGTAANVVNVTSTFQNQPVVLNSAGGNDVVNIGSSAGVQLIRADVQIQNDPAFTTININDTGNATARSAVIDQWAGNFGALAGLAQANITWDNADILEINLTTGGGDDTLAVLRCSERLNIKSSGGLDNISIGNDTNGLTAVTALTTVGPNPAFVFSNLTLNDSGNTAGRTSVWTPNANGFFINGLLPQQFRYENVLVLNVRGGTGADHYALGGITDDNIIIDGGAGAAVDSLAVDDRAFPATLVYADIGHNYMTRGTGGIFNTTYSVVYTGIESPVFYAQDSATSVNIYGPPSTIPAGQQMSVFCGAGSDTINLHIRNAQGNLTINGTLGVNGGTGNDSLVIHDSGSTGVNYRFQNLFGPGTTNISGLGTANFGAASNVEHITVNAGAGDDSFTIDTFQSGSSLTLRGNAGSDSVNWTPSTRNTVPNVTAMAFFSFDGGAGHDYFNFFNDANASAWNYTRTNNAFLASRASGGYALNLLDPNVETLYATGGAAGDQIFIQQVRPGGEVFIDGAGGSDNFFLGNAQRTQDIRGLVGIYTSGGTDSVSIDDTADTVGRTFHVGQGSVGAAPGDNLFGPGGSLVFGGVSGALTIKCGSGSDTAYVVPNIATPIFIELNGQSPAGPETGDFAGFALAGATNPQHVITGPGAGQYAFANRAPIFYSGAEQTAVDSIAPVVHSSSFEVNLPRQAVRISFSENVSNSLVPGSITLVNLTTNQTIAPANIAVAYDPALNRASFSFPGFANGVLPDGNYRMTLPAGAATDLFGNPVSADHTLNFFFLQGDANRDGRVNLSDFNILAANFGQANRTFSQADFTYDGVVNLADFNILASRFGNILSAGTAASPGGTIFNDRQISERSLAGKLDELLA